MVVNQLFYPSTRDDQQGAVHPSRESNAQKQRKRILIFADDNEPSRHIVLALEAQEYIVQHISSLVKINHLESSAGTCKSHTRQTTEFSSIHQDWEVADIVVTSGSVPYLKAAGDLREWHNDTAHVYIPVVLVSPPQLVEDLIRESNTQPDAIVTLPLQPGVLCSQVVSMLRIKHEYDVLREVIRLREDLTNMVVHDLRTPLTVITLHSAGVRRMLKQLRRPIDTPTVSKMHERAQTITDAANTMESLIADMLTIARTEANSLTLRRSWVNINDLVVTACNPQREISSTKNIDLNIKLLEHDLEVYLDRDLMRRVLDNLLANAVKFSPDGSQVDVLVEYLISESDACDAVKVSITDHGPGIDEAFQEHIFNRWEIAELKRQGVAQIGLGLTFCKLVIEAHGGQIAVDSQPGHGSTFCFSLPI